MDSTIIIFIIATIEKNDIYTSQYRVLQLWVETAQFKNEKLPFKMHFYLSAYNNKKKQFMTDGGKFIAP